MGLADVASNDEHVAAIVLVTYQCPRCGCTEDIPCSSHGPEVFTVCDCGENLEQAY